MRREQVDLQNAVVWIPDSKTPSGRAEVPLTPLAVEAFQAQMAMQQTARFYFRAIGTRTGTKPVSRGFGAALFAEPGFRTSGSTTCGPRMPRG